MDIILEYNYENKTKRIKLPVNPEEFHTNIPSSSQKVNVVGLGQVSIPQKPDLATFEIKSFFWKYLFDKDRLKRFAAAYGEALVDEVGKRAVGEGFSANGMISQFDSDKFKDVWNYVEWFEVWQDRCVPARISVLASPTESRQHIDYQVTCENFKHWIKAGEEDDFYYELSLVEYKDISSKELTTQTDTNGNIKAQKVGGVSRTKIKEKVQEIKGKPKDTLWGIARRYGEGKADDWKKIYSIPQNAKIIGNNFTDLNGKVLKMPTEWL